MTIRTIKTIKQQPNDGYEYHYITSIGPSKMYGENLSDEEYENAHIDHIISDYEEDGYEPIFASCKHKNGSLTMEFYARRKK